MTHLTTLNREQAIHLLRNEDLTNAAMISISSDIPDMFTMSSELLVANVTRSKSLRFLDIETPESGFTQRTAEVVIQELDQWITGQHRPSEIYIHCDLGASRSRSVAIFANEWYGLDQEDLRGAKNQYVYDVLIDTALQAHLDKRYVKPIQSRA